MIIAIFIIILILLIIYISKKKSNRENAQDEKLLNHILNDSKNLSQIRNIINESDNESNAIKEIRKAFGVDLIVGINIYNRVKN
ncbi:hypothetical protein WR164_00310 [Philodulcilactobacillus myokoensis]|uniref:Uncharacterized protein n=1 Tax=Philodulcilactobacillus myokoensis TaxID=2929573 RepID=A0A9W6AXZ3_9LACO|nr:hypothetical protein [Philodulcilactobacillus myokoensis]GLB46052.1 hypothetical protein WR164_00310 [Philodulcilactobacillus myokoensis]